MWIASILAVIAQAVQMDQAARPYESRYGPDPARSSGRLPTIKKETRLNAAFPG